MTSPLRIGTRGSPLALWQARHVRDLLAPLAQGRAVELVEISTQGDQNRDQPLNQLGGDGLFTREIQRALLAQSVDVAVHSLKDLPTLPEANLTLAAVPPRGSSGDVLVSIRHRALTALPNGAIVATGSLRRRTQLLHKRPDLQLVNIRGNVETRLRKLQEEGLDALILAQAGLERLGFASAITEILDRQWMLPAVGQGALGLECRTDDSTTRALLAGLDHFPTHQAVLAERSLLRNLGGGCQMPIGADTSVVGDVLSLRSVVMSADGKQCLTSESTAALAEAENLGKRVAADLLRQGAAQLLGG